MRAVTTGGRPFLQLERARRLDHLSPCTRRSTHQGLLRCMRGGVSPEPSSVGDADRRGHAPGGPAGAASGVTAAMSAVASRRGFHNVSQRRRQKGRRGRPRRRRTTERATRGRWRRASCVFNEVVTGQVVALLCSARRPARS